MLLWTGGPVLGVSWAQHFLRAASVSMQLSEAGARRLPGKVAASFCRRQVCLEDLPGFARACE